MFCKQKKTKYVRTVPGAHTYEYCTFSILFFVDFFHGFAFFWFIAAERLVGFLSYMPCVVGDKKSSCCEVYVQPAPLIFFVNVWLIFRVINYYIPGTLLPDLIRPGHDLFW